MVRPDYRAVKYSNELYHYGVKRKSGRYPWGSGARPYQGDVFKDHTLAKGTNLYRVVVGRENLRKDTSKRRSGPTYVTYNPKDRTMYKGIYVHQLVTQNKNPNDRDMIREVKYTLKKDLKVAGRDSVKRAIEKNITQYEAAVSSTEECVKRNKDRIVDNYAYFAGKYSFDEYVKKLSDNQLNKKLNEMKTNGAEYAYYQKAWILGFDEKAKNKVIDSLKQQGYDAMSDEAGIGGRGGVAKQGVEPIIIFDSSNNTMKYNKSEGISPGAKYDEDYNTGLKYREEMNKGK